MKYEVVRNVTKKECPWLDKDLKKGDVVFSYKGYTYGCISPKGMAFTVVEDETPFFELPMNSVKKIEISGGGIQEGHIFPTEDDIYLK